MFKKNLYILKRRIQALDITFVMLICRIFPIKKNKIVFITFEGKSGFCCNPKYIARELHKRNENYEMVWLVEDMSKAFPDYIRKAPYSKWSRCYHLATAKIWVNNYRNPYGTIKRKGQYYFQTWHASIGFKKIGLFRGEAFSKMAYLVSKNDSDMIDCVCSDSDWWKAIVPKGLLYSGPILDSGLPRNDDMINRKEELRCELRKKHNLSIDTKIVLYAPTFRESKVNGKRSIHKNSLDIDFDRLKSNLSSKFSGDWIVMIRLHPQLAAKMQADRIEGIPENVIDVSKEDDMYEILPGVDFFITDYSSAIFEAALGRIPAVMYTTDLFEYIRERGGLYFDFKEKIDEPIYCNQCTLDGRYIKLPFLVAKTNDELKKIILEFDTEQYELNCQALDKEIFSITNGHGSEQVADWIEARIK